MNIYCANIYIYIYNIPVYIVYIFLYNTPIYFCIYFSITHLYIFLSKETFRQINIIYEERKVRGFDSLFKQIQT